MLKKLDHLMEDAESKEYHKTVVALADTEIPSEEYLPYAKRKQRKFMQEIERLKDKSHPTADEKHELELLETRLELHNQTYNERLRREKVAAQRAGLIQQYIGE